MGNSIRGRNKYQHFPPLKLLIICSCFNNDIPRWWQGFLPPSNAILLFSVLKACRSTRKKERNVNNRGQDMKECRTTKSRLANLEILRTRHLRLESASPHWCKWCLLTEKIPLKPIRTTCARGTPLKWGSEYFSTRNCFHGTKAVQLVYS